MTNYSNNNSERLKIKQGTQKIVICGFNVEYALFQ